MTLMKYINMEGNRENRISPYQNYHYQSRFEDEENTNRDEGMQPNEYLKPKDHNYGSKNFYEERTAVSDETNSIHQYESSDNQVDHQQIPQPTPRVLHHTPEQVAKNDEYLSLLIGERQETMEQKRERQRQYREALEQQKKINEFYTRNLNPEVIERVHSRSPPKSKHQRQEYSPPSPLSNSYDSEAENFIKQQHQAKRQQYQEILHYQMKEKEVQRQMQRKPTLTHNVFARDEQEGQEQKVRQQNELREQLEQQIKDKQDKKYREQQDRQEFDRKLDLAVSNMNARVWGDKTDSHREREKEELKDELQQQIYEKKMKDNYQEQQLKSEEIEEEKRVKREVFDLNNQFRIENNQQPLPLPPELQPGNQIQQNPQDKQLDNERTAPHSQIEHPQNPSNNIPNPPHQTPSNTKDPYREEYNAPYHQPAPHPMHPQYAPPATPQYHQPIAPHQAYPTYTTAPAQPPSLEQQYPELQELREKQKGLIDSYMQEIQQLKQQKQSIMQDMVHSKKNQMQEDHKLFQDKLEELKQSMLSAQPIHRPTPVLTKGNEILAELDRMKQRLQQSRNEPMSYLHPSDNTLKNIVIENPAGVQNIDPSNYQPDYGNKSFVDLDKSLPGQTALKTGLNNSQNFKEDNNEVVLPFNPDESRADIPTIDPQKSKKSIKKRIVKQIRPKVKLDNTLKSQAIRSGVDKLDQPEQDFHDDAKSAEESIHKPMPNSKQYKEDEESSVNERDIHSQLDKTIESGEKQQDQVIENERSGSPIVPALRKKLMQSNTEPFGNKLKENEISPVRRSVTLIGQATAPSHMKKRSVTDLGVDNQESNPVEESKDLGKPPLAQIISYTPKSNKLVDGIEAKFQASKHKKFTDLISMKDHSETKPLNKTEPITARKEYFSDEDVGDKKNSFRKFILGAPDYKYNYDQKESSSEQDISLMHGLPASMKKIRQMSIDKSQNSFYENSPDEVVQKKEESSDIDLDLKFINKNNMKNQKSKS